MGFHLHSQPVQLPCIGLNAVSIATGSPGVVGLTESLRFDPQQLRPIGELGHDSILCVIRARDKFGNLTAHVLGLYP